MNIHPKATALARIILGWDRSGDAEAIQQKAEEIQAEWNEAARREEEKLRDQFAMAALTGMLARQQFSDYAITMVAEDAYRYADAMQQARKSIRYLGPHAPVE